MAFNFWRKRDDAGNTSAPETENNNNLSDVLLTALMNGERISRSQALTIPRFASDVDFVANMSNLISLSDILTGSGEITTLSSSSW